MSLATRCTACGTVFRVVQDQLRMSEGWVRCGRCHEVFNALEGLFDLQRDGAVVVPDENHPPATEAGEAGASAPAQAVAGDTAAAVSADNEHRDDAAAERPSSWAQLETNPWQPTERDRPHERWHDPERDDDVSVLPADDLHPTFRDARFSADAASDSDSFSVDAAETTGTQESAEGAQPQAAPARTRTLRDDAGFDDDAQDSTPDFVRLADRQAIWRRPAVRATLAVTAVTLAALLAAQAAHHWRDELAVRWPQTSPWLARACAMLGCRLAAPRDLESIVVDSATLARAGTANGAAASGDIYRLTVVLRNRSAFDVLQPHLELTLTDADGAVLARRSLAPTDFRADAAVLAARGDATLQTGLAIGMRNVAGYTVAAFYP
jgi:predicted Zn finger-like uncharacterized protein